MNDPSHISDHPFTPAAHNPYLCGHVELGDCLACGHPRFGSDKSLAGGSISWGFHSSMKDDNVLDCTFAYGCYTNSTPDPCRMAEAAHAQTSVER